MTADQILNNSQTELQNCLVQTIFNLLLAGLIHRVFTVDQINQFLNSLGDLHPCLQLLLTRLEQSLLQMALFYHLVPVADQPLPDVCIPLARVRVLQFLNGILGGLPAGEYVQKSSIATT